MTIRYEEIRSNKRIEDPYLVLNPVIRYDRYGMKSNLKIRSDFRSEEISSRTLCIIPKKRAELDVVRSNQITETNLSIYYESKMHWNYKIRTIVGLRGNQFQFHVDDRNSELNDRKRFSIANPKGGIVFWSLVQN